METKQTDLHKFGIGDYLTADDYKPEEEIRAKVLSFLGRQEYTNRIGDKKRAGMYKVDVIGVPQELRFGIRNEKLANKKFGIKDYEQLVGRTLVLRVKSYKLGQGFELVDVR